MQHRIERKQTNRIYASRHRNKSMKSMRHIDPSKHPVLWHCELCLSIYLSHSLFRQLRIVPTVYMNSERFLSKHLFSLHECASSHSVMAEWDILCEGQEREFRNILCTLLMLTQHICQLLGMQQSNAPTNNSQKQKQKQKIQQQRCTHTLETEFFGEIQNSTKSVAMITHTNEKKIIQRQRRRRRRRRRRRQNKYHKMGCVFDAFQHGWLTRKFTSKSFVYQPLSLCSTSHLYTDTQIHKYQNI